MMDTRNITENLSAVYDAIENMIGPTKEKKTRALKAIVAVSVIGMMLVVDVAFANYGEQTKRNKTESPRTMLTKDGLLHDYTMAKSQSYGFFDDVRVEEWELMRERVRERKNHNDEVLGPRSKVVFMDEPNAWYQNNWEPDFSCKHERKVGGLGDGAKWLCDPHRIPRTLETPDHLSIPKKTQFSLSHTNTPGYNDKINSKCLVYSIGSRGNLQFEYHLREMIGEDTCEIHIFDNTEHYNTYATLPGLQDGNVFFHPWSLEGSEDRSTQRNLMTMQETIETLGHRHRVIDVMKIDCDGCEWKVFKDWFDSDVTFMQILVEVHGSPPEANDFFETMQKHHYVTFHKEPNTLFSGGKCQEYAFLKLAPAFFT